MGVQLVTDQDRAVPDSEALTPVVDGLAETLRVLSPDDRDYQGLQKMYRLLIRGLGTNALRDVSEDAAGAGGSRANFADAIQPAMEGMRLTLRLLDEDHWARLMLKIHYQHAWWDARRPEARRPGARPPLQGPPV